MIEHFQWISPIFLIKCLILTDTLETIEAVQKEPRLLESKQEELTSELDLVLEDNPSLAQELKQLINKEAANNASIRQVIYGNVTNTASDQSTIVSGSTNGDVNITHNHNTQNHEGDGDNVMGGCIIIE